MADKVSIKLLASRVVSLRLTLVDRDQGQPRQIFPEEGLKSLAANILASGYMIYAILVKPNPEKPGRYIIIAGERRFRALQLIGLEEFDFHVAEGDVPSYLISLIENDNREDLNPIDEAEAYQTYMDREGISVMELAKFTGKHWNDIYRALRLLKLQKEVKELVRQGKIRVGKAFNLVQYRDYAEQIRLAQRLMAGEDPPEIDEKNSKTSERGEAMIEARLPDTVAGLIRRMLEFRQRCTSIRHVISAYFNHTKGEQTDAWCSFTKPTRENLVAELRKIIPLLQDLLARIEVLPETKQTPRGAAAAALAQKEAVVSENKTAVLQNQVKAEPAVASKPVRLPTEAGLRLQKALRAAPTTRQAPAASEPEKKTLSKPAPTANELEEARKVLHHIATQVAQGKRRFTSKALLAKAFGNGSSPENVEASAVKAFRLIERFWNTPFDPRYPETSALIEQVSHMRHDANCKDFRQFVRAIKFRDNSPDPIGFGGLLG